MGAIAVCRLESKGPYSQSRLHATPKKNKEQPDAYEERTWREKGHYTKEGKLYIPAVCFKTAIWEAAVHLGEKVKGRGQATWTKHFLRGVHCFEPVVLDVSKDDVACCPIYCSPTGKKGDGKRVLRFFPQVEEWAGDVTFDVVDSLIDKATFLHHLTTAGGMIGIGRWRVGQGGQNGRFIVASIDWQEN